MIRIKFSILLIGMLSFLLTSCFVDSENDGGESANGQVNVTFSVALPQPENVNTQARASYSDTDIKNVDALIFDKSGKFMERIKVDAPALIVTPSGVKFSIRLDATQDRRTIHLVANGRTADGVTDRLDFERWLIPGTTEAGVVLPLSTVVTDNSSLLADITPLVMWGRTVINGVSAVSSATVNLLRTVAAVQVKVASATSDNGLGDFQLKKIALIDAPTEGFLTPNSYLSSDFTPSDNYPVVGSPVWELSKSWSIEGAPILYTYERDYSTSVQNVIISADYKGQAGFYKVALVENEKDTPLKIIRNHRYTLTVMKVNGRGYSDLATAVTSAPSNAIKVSLTDDDEDFPCLVADGQHLMGLSNNSAVVYGRLTVAELGTVYSSRGVKPILSVPVDCDWLVGLSIRELGNKKYAIVGNFNYTTAEPRSTTLTLTCDNLQQTMQVDLYPSVSDTKDADSYVVTLFGPSDKNWTAVVNTSESDSKGVFLSAVTSNPADFTPSTEEGLEKMVTSLNSIYASNAYLHLAAGGKGTVKVSTFDGRMSISRKIVISVP